MKPLFFTFEKVTSKMAVCEMDSSASSSSKDTGYEIYDTANPCKPSQVKHAFSVSYSTLESTKHIFGKWMAFEHFDKVDEAWEKIRRAMAADELQGCVEAKCSTLRYDPTKHGPGPNTCAGIRVYTNENNIEAIGFKLIKIAQQDIKYKTNENDTFAHASSEKVATKTIYWNRGKPSLELKGKKCSATSFQKKDIWHLNIVNAPEPFGSQEVHGRWILVLENEESTKLWHHIKDMIECNEKNPGIIEMVCPPKRERKLKTEMPKFHVYTSSTKHESVGKKLVELLKNDIQYVTERNPQYGDTAGAGFGGAGDVKTLYWNDGEPDYEKKNNAMA